MQVLISNIFTTILLGYLAFIFLQEKQDGKLNWAIFFATLYTLITLPIVNIVCVNYNLWSFNDGNNIIKMPFNIYFIWLIIWTVVPIKIFKGKKIALISFIFLGLDLLIMTTLHKLGLVKLNSNWLIGEFALLLLVFVPAYYWAYVFYENKQTGIRAVFQILTLGILFLVGIPYLAHKYDLINIQNIRLNGITIQMLFIAALPSLIAVNDLVKFGKGTPFPYDPTKKLVQYGAYSYIKNPIQWSAAIIFIAASFIYNTPYMLIVSIAVITYSFWISDFQEKDDMQKRFGDKWNIYFKNTPKWYFSWKSDSFNPATIYFDENCNQCSEISKWLESKKAVNLSIAKRSDFPSKSITKVTLLDEYQNKVEGIEAIALSIERINLLYASLSWLIRLPVILQITQLITAPFYETLKQKNCKI